MKKLLLALLLVLALPLSANAYSWSANTASATAEAQVESLIQREHYDGCGRYLTITTPLLNISRWRSKDMVTRNYFSHYIPPSNYLVFHYFSQFGVSTTGYSGEIIGWNNYPPDLSPAAIFQAWMNSAGHRAIIESCTYNAFAIGSYQGSSGKKMYTGVFTKMSSTTSSTPVSYSTRYVSVRPCLNLRTGPSTGYSIKACEYYGTRLRVYKSSGSWYYVSDPYWRYGWVYGPYTRR